MLIQYIYLMIHNITKKDRSVFILLSLKNVKIVLNSSNYKQSPLLAITFLYQSKDFFLFLSNVPLPLSSKST